MIKFSVRQLKYFIPNSWEELTPDLYEGIIHDINLVAIGKLSPAMLHINHVCRSMGWDTTKINSQKDDMTLSNLAWLGEQINFIFRVSYPDHDLALQDLSPEDYKRAKSTPPERLHLPIARVLCQLDYKYHVDNVFCGQMIPSVKIGQKLYEGYRIDTSFNRLTCSLSSLQYIEARTLIGCASEQLPLLAAILYHPGTYNSESAHTLASEFTKLSLETLQGIAFNFSAFTNYLFQKTDFRILVAGTDEKTSPITTGALDSLYSLSNDGYGDVVVVEQMNIIQYLTIVRKRLIDGVKSLHAVDMSVSEISIKTGLPINIINQII